jgi:hypothetical protein
MFPINHFFNILVLLTLILNPFSYSQLAGESPARALPATPESQDSLPDYSGEMQLVVRNQATLILPTGYTVGFQLDTASLITYGELQSNCNDLRITYNDGSTETELDRLVEGCNSASTTVRFRTRAQIAVAGWDAGYRLYFNNPSASSPPAGPGNVYAFYDDFQDGNADGWNAAKGTWGVVDDGGDYVYRYSGGGANWAISYIPLANAANLEILSQIRASATTTWIGLAFRIQDANNFLTFYESRDGNLLKYARVVGDNHGTPPATAVSSMTANTWYSLRVQAVGSAVRARIWQTGTAEPITWLIQYTDTTFQSQTNFGATQYYQTTNTDWDDIQVRRLVDVEPIVEVYVPTPPISGWYYRAPITVANSSATASLPVDYSVQLTLDTSALIASGRMLASCADLQIGSLQGSEVYEIDRVVENCNTAATRVWFALKRPILPGATDPYYYLYYGDPASPPPMADAANVFLFFEDWENGAIHWTSAGGLDTGNTGTMGLTGISSEDYVSSANSQKFPTKAAGGDAFSGYIPVAPNTSYAIGTWAKSAENTFAPVGINPYTAAYVVGSEQWLWTNDWTIGPAWSWRNAQFTTGSTTAFIKIKSEWWAEAPGSQPVYMDNLFLRYAIAIEPVLTLGTEETTLVVPVISDIQNTGPVNLGLPVSITANLSTAEGEIDGATLRIVSPASVDVPMSLTSGTATDGVWQASYTPSQGGVYSYRILAHATTGRQTTSALQTFSVIDSSPPEITGLSFTNPILVNESQTVTVNVTDNGVVSTVSLTVGGVAHPMTPSGDQYSYTWQVTTIGEIPFTIIATDSANNQSQLSNSFTSQAREVDVCTWKGCKPAAASWSNDDSNSNCTADLVAAGFRGTYYVNGSTPQQWYTDYSAAGHEIGAHTVSHPCNGPCCSPNCTPESIWQCPYTQTVVDDYRANQFDPNVASIETATELPVLSGAWPCGCTDAGRMTAAMFYFLGVRGYNDCGCSWVQDNNQPTPIMFMNLNGLHAYDQSYIDRAITDSTWTIVTSHGSCDGISYMGSRSDVLWLPTVGEGLKYIKVRNAAQFSNYNRVGRTISFDAVHNLATFNRQQLSGAGLLPIVFDNPVTLKVHILDSDNVLSVLVNGTPVTYQMITLAGVRYVIFDTPLNTSRHVVVNLTAPAPTIGQISDNGPVELGQAAQVNAVVTVSEGTIESVTLRVLSPQPADYPMNLVSGSTDTYRASFSLASLANRTYQILATNDSGGSSTSAVHTLAVVDTTPPGWRSQAQSSASIPVGSTNSLSAEGFDLGGLQWATLSTNESGVWQEFTWPVSDWWNMAWPYRVPVQLTETAGLARTAETVDVLVSSSLFTGLSNCAAELRVADADKNELPVQVYGESNSGGALSCHLLFQASLAANQSRMYYIYYGNLAATPPSYASDLNSSTSGELITVQNSFLNLDLNTSGGVISRLRLPGGTNTNLPLSTQANSYWGLHQVCSSDGNITGKNNLCSAGTAPASGLVLSTLIDGPVVKEYELTSQKGAATYHVVFRFYANSPFYRYTLGVTGATTSVMNNFWYYNGYYDRLGAGSGVTPASIYNTYGSGLDQIRFASFDTIEYTLIDGGDNDGTQLGGADYRYPSASGLNLWVTTGASQADTQLALSRLAAPVTAVLGTAVEEAPETRYGSPASLNGAVAWTPAAFPWQNPAITNGTNVQWRVNFCDLSGNCASTGVLTFLVGSNLPVLPSSFYGEIHIHDNPPVAGATVEAYMPGVIGPAASAVIAEDGGQLVYSLNVPAGDKGAAAEGETVTFRIGGRVVATGTWHSGTNVELNFHPPQALPGVSYAGYAGAAIAFSASADDGGNDAAVYEWDWDNNGTYDEIGQSPSHTWADPGSYTVGLRVTDVQGGVGTATTVVNVQAYPTHSLDLVRGWNLVSFNLHPVNTDIAAVLATISGNYSLVYGWANGAWQRYDPALEYGNTLATLDESKGFWVQMTATDTLVVTGTAPGSSDIALQAGWNLVGFPATGSLAMPGALTGHGVEAENLNLVLAMHASQVEDPWLLYDPAAPPYASDLSGLAPGWGYWIKVDAEDTWTVTYQAP